MSFRDEVLAALTDEGQTYEDLRRRFPGCAPSNLSSRLSKLRRAGLAVSEPAPRPPRRKHNSDYTHLPRVVWRRA